MIESFLNHLGEGRVKAEIIEIMVCQGLQPSLSVLLLQTLEAAL
jgi:hypothetical protein